MSQEISFTNGTILSLARVIKNDLYLGLQQRKNEKHLDNLDTFLNLITFLCVHNLDSSRVRIIAIFRIFSLSLIFH